MFLHICSLADFATSSRTNASFKVLLHCLHLQPLLHAWLPVHRSVGIGGLITLAVVWNPQKAADINVRGESV